MKYEIFFWGGIALWILENVYFGWNLTAMSGAERVCDTLSNAMMLIGLVGIVARDAVKDL